jgi:hypothetical protein
MQIVESFGTHASSKSENVQVTLSNAADILAVFPQLSSNVDATSNREYDHSTNQYAEMQNVVIIKKCERPILNTNILSSSP